MDFVEMGFGLVAGLGLFIYGMQLMADGLQKAAGDRMRRLLEILTSNALLAVLVGTVITIIVASSSASTVMVIGFVNAGLMTLRQAIGVILGANIGTTVTTQLVSFKLTRLAAPAIGVGMLLITVAKRKQTKDIGRVILGFGILFFGMDTMGAAMKPLRTYEPFIELMSSIGDNPLLGVLIAAGFTALVQSSSATTAIVVALASQGLLDLHNALPLVLGSNIGTTVTALLASINTTLTSKRAAVAHALFNVTGVVAFMFILRPFGEFAASTAVLAERQIANAHTIFNVISTLIVLPFINQFTALVMRIVPGEELVVKEPKRALYLDEKLLSNSSIALGQATRELLRMGKIAIDMLDDTENAFENNDMKSVDLAQEREEIINYLETEITHYLVDISERSLTSEESHRLNYLFETVNDIERVGDHAQNIAELSEHKIENRLPFSDEAVAELREMYAQIKTMVEDSLEVLRERNVPLAKRILEKEDQIDDMEKQLRQSHIDRVSCRKCHPASGIVFLDVISNFERIADHASNIAIRGISD